MATNASELPIFPFKHCINNGPQKSGTLIRRLLLQIRAKTNEEKRQAFVEKWYREQLKQAIPNLIAKWEPWLGVRVNRFFVQKMKTKWGSCSLNKRSLRFNTDLAKKPPECLEYIVVHELAHMLEPTHNNHFIALMDRFMPNWRFHRNLLNRLPVRHEKWSH